MEPSIIGRVGVSVLVLLFLAVFGLVVFQAVLAQSQRNLDDLRTDLAAQEQRSKALRLDFATAASPERVASAARTRLGMIPPAGGVFLEPQPGDDSLAAYVPGATVTTTTPTTNAYGGGAPVAPIPPTTTWTAPAAPTTSRPPTTTTTRPSTTTTTARPATTTTTRAVTTTTRPKAKV